MWIPQWKTTATLQWKFKQWFKRMGRRIKLEDAWHEKSELIYSRRDWLFSETTEKWNSSSSDTEEPSILAVFSPASSIRPPDSMIDIILTSMWLQHISFTSSTLSFYYLSPKHSCLLGVHSCLCPSRIPDIAEIVWRKDCAIKRLWHRSSEFVDLLTYLQPLDHLTQKLLMPTQRSCQL